MPDAIFICGPLVFDCEECGTRHGECLLCGGWLHVEQTDGHDGLHCSKECADEAARFAARAKRERDTNWCPSCGYDNWEHAPDCVPLNDGGGADD